MGSILRGVEYKGVSLRESAHDTRNSYADPSHHARTVGNDVAYYDERCVVVTAKLTIVQYERLPDLIRQRSVWKQIAISMLLNWIIGPFVRVDA